MQVGSLAQLLQRAQHAVPGLANKVFLIKLTVEGLPNTPVTLT